jgi:transcriptional regulator with XRE-family HTH domain
MGWIRESLRSIVLKRRREIPQKRIAAETGIKPSSLSQYLTGRRPFPEPELCLVIEYLGLRLSDLELMRRGNDGWRWIEYRQLIEALIEAGDYEALEKVKADLKFLVGRIPHSPKKAAPTSSGLSTGSG